MKWRDGGKRVTPGHDYIYSSDRQATLEMTDRRAELVQPGGLSLFSFLKVLFLVFLLRGAQMAGSIERRKGLKWG